MAREGTDCLQIQLVVEARLKAAANITARAWSGGRYSDLLSVGRCWAAFTKGPLWRQPWLDAISDPFRRLWT